MVKKRANKTKLGNVEKEQKDSDRTIAELAAQEGYNSVTMSMYFCIATSGGMAPNFCHACLEDQQYKSFNWLDKRLSRRATKMGYQG